MERSPSSVISFLRQNARRLQSPRPFLEKATRNLNLVVGGGDRDKGDQIKQEECNHHHQQQQQIDFTEVIAGEVCKTIRTQPRWERTLLSDFPSLGRDIFHHSNCILEILKRQNNAFFSIRFFNWLCSHPDFSPDSQTCNTLFDILVAANAPNAAKSLLLRSPPGFCPPSSSLESFIKCVCEEGSIHEALDVFSRLKSLGHTPPLAVWNVALLGSLRIGRTDLVWELYGEMMESSLVGNVDTVGYLIQAFCKDKKLSEAYELLRQVLEAGHVPDNVAFTKLISGLCKDGNYGKVSELLHLMIAKKRTPDIFVYQEIINGLCKNGMGQEAFRIFCDLKERGYSPDRVMYTTMIDGLCKMGLIGEGRKLWFEMIRKGFIPNPYTYNVLIDGYCKMGDLEMAQKLRREMCERGYGESTVSYNTMIAGFCLHGKMDEAHKLFEEMPKKGIERDVVTYNTLIQGLCKEKKALEAMDLFYEILGMGMHPTISSYTPLIQALCDMGNAQEAIELWNDMRNRGLEPLVCTCDHIITGLCKAGNAKESMEWLINMLRSKQRPQRETFQRLVQYLSSSSRLDDALLVLDYLFGMGYILDETVLYSLVSQLCKGNLHHAWEYIGEILEKS
ncbi:PREDICTED: pentatricopeptide repeat-containing protein At5g18950 [Nelumbo nucifera]|uniref:Pentatricopeptide repeat-containing protein At5g18950 n=2 Tax=Nelumbo nucifera TaxID=4432 RepID=A0A1U8A3D7_NELNU|nr:PREDICTED: pentatricopeptide repeat-containing protein At5g18950 [Nelumbo nucifera]